MKWSFPYKRTLTRKKWFAAQRYHWHQQEVGERRVLADSPAGQRQDNEVAVCCAAVRYARWKFSLHEWEGVLDYNSGQVNGRTRLLERRIWGNTVIRSVMNDVSAAVGTDVINELLRGTTVNRTHLSYYPFLRSKPLFLLFSYLLALSSSLYVMVTVWEHYSSTYCFVFISSVRRDVPGKSTTANLLHWEPWHHFPKNGF